MAVAIGRADQAKRSRVASTRAAAGAERRVLGALALLGMAGTDPAYAWSPATVSFCGAPRTPTVTYLKPSAESCKCVAWRRTWCELQSVCVVCSRQSRPSLGCSRAATGTVGLA
jgi:hypothetical protein